MFEPKSNGVYLIDLDLTVVDSSSEYERWKSVCSEISCPNFLEDGHHWCSVGSKASCFRQEFKARGIFDNEAILKLPPVKGARKALQKISQGFYVSGRGESTRRGTLDWLEKYGFPLFRLYLRRESDLRRIPEYKRETYWVIREIHGKLGQEFFVIDDDENIREVCMELGMGFLKAPECFEGGK